MQRRKTKGSRINRLNKQNMRKVFDENGDLRIRFSIDSKEQIEEWLSPVKYSYALKFAEEVNSFVFGKSIEFPCKMIKQ